MGFLDALRTSGTGLSAQRMRMNVISRNLANIHTTRTESGEPYRRKDLVFAAVPGSNTFGEILNETSREVEVLGVIDDPRPFQLRYEPGHPDADPDGYVQYPNVDPMEEMVNMISASRGYEANVTAVNASKRMAQRALEIGK